MENLSDEKLVELYKRGDASAFEELYRRYTRLVSSLSRSLFLAGGDADDLMQEGFLGLVNAASAFDASRGASFSTFAYSCVRKKIQGAVDAANAKKHKPLNDYVPLTELAAATDFLEPSPEDTVIGNESFEELLALVRSRLTRLETKVFNRYLSGEKYTEIAAALGVEPKKVDNAMWRIKNKIKKITDR